MTQLADSHLREASEALARERNMLKNKVENLESAIAAKSEEMSRMRDYYTGII